MPITHFHKSTLSSLLKRISSKTLKTHSLSNPTLLHTSKPTSLQTQHTKTTLKLTHAHYSYFKEAQSALLDYLYYTRNLSFLDAEHITLNSPHFLLTLLAKIGASNNVGKSLSLYFRYSPINEFEPFYESLGLQFHEYSSILPRDLTFLCDDPLLFQNYKFLCKYGVERKQIGKIVKEARDALWYENGVLALKLEAFERLGLSRSFVAKMVVSSPYLLIGDVNEDLVRVILILQKAGISLSLVEEHLSENACFNWSRLLALLDFFRLSGYSEEMLGCLHPGILFEGSGKWTLLVIGFLTKFGCDSNKMYSLFKGFPKLELALFLANLRRSFQVLNDIEIGETEIGKMFCAHTLLLGSYKLKTAGSLLCILNIGKERLRKLILENPLELGNLKVGSKVERLPKVESESRKRKIAFLKELGFMDEPNEIVDVFKKFRGSGAEIQERFDFLVEAGLDKKDVCSMIKLAPQILNLSMDILKNKIDYLVNDLGYPISLLVTFPTYLNYTQRRVKLRLAMYGWLKDEARISSQLSFSTLLCYSDKRFLQIYVKPHQKGLQVFEDLKRKIYSDLEVDRSS